MENKAAEFHDPLSNKVYCLQVWADGWMIFVKTGVSDYDWGNPITNLSHIKKTMRQTIKLQISKYKQDLAARFRN